MKNLILTSVLVYILLSCISSQEKNEDQLIDLETIEINAAFRAQLITGDFVKLSAGYTYYEYENRESDTVLVFVHGFSVPGYIWDSTYYAAIDKGYGALRFDTYGRGASDNPDVVYNDELYTLQLKELLDILEISNKINLLGLSYGGRIISVFAALYPEKIQNLIYVDPAGFHPLTDDGNYPIEVTKQEVIDFKQSENYASMATGQLGDFYDPKPFIGWDKQYEEVMKYKGFVRALLSTIKNRPPIIDSHKKIAAANLPVYCFWGTYDTVVVLDEVRDTLNQRIPQLKLFEIPNSGHLPHMEQTQLFNEILFDQIIISR